MHPFLTLLLNQTFSVDPKKSGAEAFSIGTSNLPSVMALKNSSKIAAQISRGEGVFAKSNKALKIFTFDVETTGLGMYDQVRSLAGSTMLVDEGSRVRISASELNDLVRRGRLSREAADNLLENNGEFSTHFVTPQMERYTMRNPDTGLTSRLGTGVAALEKGAADIVSDLSTLEGRRQAVSQYKKFLKQATEADLVAGHNVGFDIQKMMMSVSSLPEFTSDREAMELHKRFGQMINEGKVINTLDIARGYLTDKVRISLGSVDNLEETTEEIIRKMFPGEDLARIVTGGSATPYSVGSIAAQTNLLDLIEGSGPEGKRLIERLSSVGTAGTNSTAAHVAETDVKLTEYLMSFIHTGELQYGFAGSQDVIKAREQILKSSAIVPTTNIADVRHMSDAVYNYTMSKRGMINATFKTEDGSIIKGSKATGKFYITAPDGTQREFTEHLDLKAAIESGRRGEKSILEDSGISYLQATRMDRIIQNSQKALGITNRVSSISSSLLSETPNIQAEEQIIQGLTSTRELLGFENYAYRPDIFSERGMTRLMSAASSYIKKEAADNYLTRLTAAGIKNAVEDPFLRRTFVELATVTSDIPFSETQTPKKMSFSERMVNKLAQRAAERPQMEQSTLAQVGEAVTPENMADRVALFNANVGKKVSRYLSEFGISFADSNQANILISGSGDVSRAIVSQEILRNIDVTIGEGSEARTVKFLSDEFLSDYSRNIFGLSVAERKGGEKVVNLVYGNLAANVDAGEGIIDRKLAEELSTGIVDYMQAKIQSVDDIQTLVDEGFFADVQQANAVSYRLNNAGRGGMSLKDELTEMFMRRSFSVGSISEKPGEGVATILEQVGGGIGNDVVAFNNGMQFAVTRYEEGQVVFQPRVDQQTLDVLEVSGQGQMAEDIRTGRIAQENLENFESAMIRSAEDPGFVRRIVRAFHEARVDTGIAGTRFLRDESVRQAYKKAAPKIGIGLAGVALLSAGYYIARKKRENDLYDETLKEQPLEGRGQVSSANNNLISNYTPTSTRRDPLVTAGVVGNLDRSKIGHTAMGPNKYDYLYR